MHAGSVNLKMRHSTSQLVVHYVVVISSLLVIGLLISLFISSLIGSLIGVLL